MRSLFIPIPKQLFFLFVTLKIVSKILVCNFFNNFTNFYVIFRNEIKNCDDDLSLKLKALEESVFEKDKLIRDLKDQLHQFNMDPMYRSDLVRTKICTSSNKFVIIINHQR